LTAYRKTAFFSRTGWFLRIFGVLTHGFTGKIYPFSSPPTRFCIQTYDDLFKRVEIAILTPLLISLLSGVRDYLGETDSELSEYLALPLQLLDRHQSYELSERLENYFTMIVSGGMNLMPNLIQTEK
jgi:hypothetical protein